MSIFNNTSNSWKKRKNPPNTHETRKSIMSLVVLGTVALDHVKTPSGAKKDMLGGSAAHFAMSARLFTDVHMVAVVGKDFPVKHLDFLSRKGIDISSIKISRRKTFRWRGEYKKGDLNTALTLATELGVLQTYVP